MREYNKREERESHFTCKFTFTFTFRFASESESKRESKVKQERVLMEVYLMILCIFYLSMQPKSYSISTFLFLFLILTLLLLTILFYSISYHITSDWICAYIACLFPHFLHCTICEIEYSSQFYALFSLFFIPYSPSILL